MAPDLLLKLLGEALSLPSSAGLVRLLALPPYLYAFIFNHFISALLFSVAVAFAVALAIVIFVAVTVAASVVVAVAISYAVALAGILILR